ncbi:MAG TPA: iron-containing alcohol dehydrogenase [Anaerolineaceae bacterium]|jgi:NADP-dependent alcohol dehydrogenase|nr:iron-containing alcohol dehydrogenase [Anaerolineaceae bacterium]
MNNFEFFNPTRIIFGKGTIAKLSKRVPRKARVMLLYGGGSIKENGVYDQAMDALKKHEVLEFGGIEANPDYATLLKAIKRVRKKQVDFLLAVGGGSVIDGTKFISLASPNESIDPWDILVRGSAKNLKKAIPFGTVLTLPATGSEFNHNAVISRRETGEKLSFATNLVYPRFSILDPETTYSLPKNQLRNGLVDAFVHVMEQYLTYPTGAVVQDRQSEALLMTIMEIAPAVLRTDPPDYDARASLMWVCSNALNHLIGVGVPQDWATHSIGHELTALYGLAHAESLAVVLPWLLWVKRDQKREKLLQYGYRVMDQKMQKYSERIDRTIEATAAFFQSIGMPTTLTSYGVDPDGAAAKVQARWEARGWSLGEHNDITGATAAEVLRLSR